MKNKTKAAALALAVFAAFSLTGCGERVEETEKQTETQPVTETEAVTEVIILTEAPETETEEATEAVTEAVLEPETEVTADLPADEELEAESEYASYVTMYANDDVNVRDTPSTESSDYVVDSFDQGEEVTVSGETPHWYQVKIDEFTGYVHKDGLSETVVEPKTAEERSAAADAEAAANAASSVSSTADTVYSESFTIALAADANLRSRASQEGDILDTIPDGTIVTAIGETGDWYEVEYNGTVGYVSKGLVG